MPYGGKRSALFMLILCLSIGSGGCAQIDPSASKGTTRRFVGIMTISIPKARGPLDAYKINVVGVSALNGLHIGWMKAEEVVAPPDACRLLVIVRSKAEAAEAARIIEQIPGGDPCVVDLSASSR